MRSVRKVDVWRWKEEGKAAVRRSWHHRNFSPANSDAPTSLSSCEAGLRPSSSRRPPERRQRPIIIIDLGVSTQRDAQRKGSPR